MFTPSTRLPHILKIIVVFVFPFAHCLAADNPESMARSLARKVKSAARAEKATCVAWANQAGISEQRSQELLNAFINESDPGMTAGSETANCPIHVFVEKTASKLLLVATLESGTEKFVFITETARGELSADSTMAQAPKLQKELVWQQNGKILDAILLRDTNGGQKTLLILTPELLAIYQQTESSWKLKDTRSLPPPSEPRRLLRGQFIVSGEQPDRVKINLADKSCLVNLGGEAAMACQLRPESWKEGALLSSGCGGDAWWLHADSGDRVEPDRLLLSLAGTPKAKSALDALSLPGPVVAISSGEGPGAGTVVVFNLATGNYEIYRITLACTN